MPVIRVAIVEDQRATREGLVALIGNAPGFEVAGQFSSMDEAIGVIGKGPPDVLLSDVGLPGITGVEGVRRIHQRFPELPVLMLTVHGDDDSVFAALCAGACGYLLKETEPARLLDCIREVHAGGAPMSPEVARRVVVTLRGLIPPGPRESVLSVRQSEILQLLAQGHSYKSCAESLNVSLDTIRFHVRKIYDRLHVNSRAEAVWKAYGPARK